MAHHISQVEGELTDLFNKTFNNGRSEGFIRVGGVIVEQCYERSIDTIEKFEVRDDDIWVCSFPKSGTTWTQEMVWCIANDLNFEKAKLPLKERFPYFEMSALVDDSILSPDSFKDLPENMKNSINFTAALPSPRFIKTHLPFDLLPRQIKTGEKKPKIIHVARNPKDTCISYYHHSLMMGGFTGDFNEHCSLFMADKVPYGPFWQNVLSYWKRRTDDNILLNTFEDMKKDLPLVIRKTAKFLGKNLTSDQVSALTEHLSFESMKNNPAANNEDMLNSPLRIVTDPKVTGKFMRKGEVDQWKADMSNEYIRLFDDWTRQNLKGTDLSF